MPKLVDPSLVLSCTLCPKAPTFSDASHLLTHISSKSHLSHRFKLQIRAESEQDAKTQLEAFDKWYYSNNLHILLSDRLATKEKNKASKERKEKRNITASSQLKVDTESVFQAPMAPMENLMLAPLQSFHPDPVPQMHLWTTGPASIASTSNEKLGGESVYETPTSRRRVPNFATQETLVSTQVAASFQTPRKFNQAEELSETKDKKLSDSNRLKGVFWPGMDLFDSATPEMKRKRNQRKDGSVLAGMIATSRGTEPTEIVYSMDVEYAYTRDIFGPLSAENSPNKAEIPTVKIRKPRKASGALADISVNAPRRATRGTMAKAADNNLKRSYNHKRGQANRNIAGQAMALLQGPSNLLVEFNHQYAIKVAEEDEFQATVGDMTTKRGFSIFQDINDISPGRTESPIEDNSFAFSANGFLGYHPADTATDQNVSPTPLAKANFRGPSMETRQSKIHTQGQSNKKVSTLEDFSLQSFYDPVTAGFGSFSPSLTSGFNPLHSNYHPPSLPYMHQSNDDSGHFNIHSSYSGDFRNLTPNPVNSLRHGQQDYGSENGPNNVNGDLSTFGLDLSFLASDQRVT